MWLAAGYRKPGDRFRAAADRGWWSRAFPATDELYQLLDTMGRAYDNEHPTTVEPIFASPIAAMNPDALKGYLTLAWETLQAARAKGVEGSPIGVPKIPRVPRPPSPIPPPPDVIPRPPLPIPTGGGGRGFFLLLVLGLVAYGTRKGRR